jgi:signal transduction histidine kinase
MADRELKRLKEENDRLEKLLAAQAIELEKKKRDLEIESALEKVRIKASGMRSSSELAETSAILFKQLNQLRISALRTSVGILDDANDAMELWVTSYTGDGNVTRVLDYVNLHIHPVFENIIPARRHQKPYALTVLSGQDVKSYYLNIGTYLHLPKQKKYNQQEFYYAFFFTEGSINVVTDHPLTEEECNTMVRFALAFGMVYSRFLELKKAEANLEELRATQSQLIQSEKMASLGELTAGIAHEIKNPLNFVNNFSEVNRELIGELEQHLNAGEIEEAKAIARDISDNEKKIIEHGKRADDIVKSMLQHSRSGTGKKELTDINNLCDEFLRLSYHGLRAKDKSFNAKFDLDLDPAVEPLEVVPQEIGRVLLNLINNAFYATSKKSARHDDGFNPTVTISTKKEKDRILISVKDNGDGIPEKDLYKIFHPFFTTKPSGEGTGLGLSISYDIIKAHGGEINVESSPGKWCRFIVSIPLDPAMEAG